MSSASLDLKAAWRTLSRARFTSGLCVAAFALGIGAATATFAIFDAVLLRPLPFPSSERLVAVFDTQPACAACPASFPKYHDWRARNHVFAAIGGSAPRGLSLSGAGDPVRVRAAATTASFWQVFGVAPALGRVFAESEDVPGGPKLVVLSHGLWSSRFGGERSLIGRSVLLDGEPHEVIGVMPPSFAHRGAELFVPLQRELDPATRGSHFLATFARLRDGVPVEQARAEMKLLGDALAREFGTNHGIDVQPYVDTIVGNVRAPLRLLLGAVFLVLLIACANVANLLLAAALARRRELAIRLALGAGPGALARQLAVEGALLACMGGALGVALATWLLRVFVLLAGQQLPRGTTIAIDARVLAFTAVVSVAVGVACGMWPLVLLRARELAQTIREGDLRTGSAAGGRWLGAVAVSEIALTFVLLAGAGLLVKNLALLLQRDAGLRTARVLAFDLAPSGPRYADDERALGLFRELQARLESVGGIESVGMTSHLPLRDFGYNGEFQVEGGAPWPASEAPLVEYRWLQGDYFGTLGVPLLEGRMLGPDDRRGSTRVLVNRAMAEKFWPGTNPLGKRFGQGDAPEDWYEVVGVVGDVRSRGLGQSAPYEFYRTIEQSPQAALTVVLRTRAEDPTSLVPTIRGIVASLDPDLPLSRVQTLEDVAADSVGQRRLVSAVSAVFGLLAAALAIVGVHGVMAYVVRCQLREFGVRLALGAQPAGVRRLVRDRGLRLAAQGIAVGALGAWAFRNVLRSVLDDVQPADGGVLAATVAVLLAACWLASWLPARWASRVDPIVALRDPA